MCLPLVPSSWQTKRIHTYAQYAFEARPLASWPFQEAAKAGPRPGKEVEFLAFCLKRNTPQEVKFELGVTQAVLFPKAHPWNTAPPHLCPVNTPAGLTWLAMSSAAGLRDLQSWVQSDTSRASKVKACTLNHFELQLQLTKQTVPA